MKASHPALPRPEAASGRDRGTEASAPFTSSETFEILRICAFLLALDGMNALIFNPTSALIKYAFSALILVTVAFCPVRYGVLNLRPLFPLAFLFMSIAAVTGYIAAMGDGVPSYLTALFPLMIVGVAAFIPADKSRIDADRALRVIVHSGILFAVVQVSCQILWVVFPVTNDLLRGEVPNSGVVHVKTIVFVLATAAAVLSRRRKAATLLALLSLATLALRPSSTFVAAFALSIGIAFLLKSRFRKVGLALGFALIAALLLFPLAFLADPATAGPFFDIEPYIKVQLMENISNNDFRLAVLEVARSDILSHSLLFGQHFSGSEAVYIADVRPDFDDYVAIHSDLFIIIKYSGLLGYSVFSAGMLGAAGVAARGLARAAAASGESAIFGAMFCAVVTLLIYISYNPMLEIWSVTFYVWFLLLFGALAARTLPRARSSRGAGRSPSALPSEAPRRRESFNDPASRDAR